MSERAQLLRELEAQLRGRDPGFGEILDALAEAVTIRDPHHHILYANRAALESMGFASLEDMQRHPPHSIFADYIVHDEHGEELTMDAIPSVRLLAGEQAEPLVMRTINRSTGELKLAAAQGGAAPRRGRSAGGRGARSSRTSRASGSPSCTIGSSRARPRR